MRLTPLLMVGLCAGLAGMTALSDAFATVSHQKRHAKSASKAAIDNSAAKPVILTQQRGTELDKQARLLSVDDIATSRRHHEEPVVLIGSAPLSTRKDEVALFVELQSAALCGSAGCTTDVYLKRDGQWVKVLDSVSGTVAILPQSHGGMFDIVVDGSDKWIWRNGSYQDTIAAAPIGNLRGEIKSFQSKHGIKDN